MHEVMATDDPIELHILPFSITKYVRELHVEVERMLVLKKNSNDLSNKETNAVSQPSIWVTRLLVTWRQHRVNLSMIIIYKYKVVVSRNNPLTAGAAYIQVFIFY